MIRVLVWLITGFWPRRALESRPGCLYALCNTLCNGCVGGLCRQHCRMHCHCETELDAVLAMERALTP